MKNLTFWNTSDYNYPGFGNTVQVPDGLGGAIGVTFKKVDFDDNAWKKRPDGDIVIKDDDFLSGELDDEFGLTGKVQSITSVMPRLVAMGSKNSFSITLDFTSYKASAIGSSLSDGATCGDTFIALSRFFNGSKCAYTSIKVSGTALDGADVNLSDWKVLNSGKLPALGAMGSHNAKVFLNVEKRIISGRNSSGQQEFCPSPPDPGTVFGTDVGLGLLQLSSTQRYTTLTFTYTQERIPGANPNDLQDISVASNTTILAPIKPPEPTIDPPVVEPPVVEPPIVEPPIVEPPIVEPPIVEPPIIDPIPPTIVYPPDPDPIAPTIPQPIVPTPVQPVVHQCYVMMLPPIFAWGGFPYGYGYGCGQPFVGWPGQQQQPYVVPPQPYVVPPQPYVVPPQPYVVPPQPPVVGPGQQPYVVPGRPPVVPPQPPVVGPGQQPYVVPGRPPVVPPQPPVVGPGQQPYVVPGQPPVAPPQPPVVGPGQQPYVVPGRPPVAPPQPPYWLGQPSGGWR